MAALNKTRIDLAREGIITDEVKAVALDERMSAEQLSQDIAEGLTEGVPAPEDTEDLQLLKLPVSQAVDMAISGKITDAISVSALLKYALTRTNRMN